MNMLFFAANLLYMEKGVGILNWCRQQVVETETVLPVITFCLILAGFSFVEVHVVTVLGLQRR